MFKLTAALALTTVIAGLLAYTYYLKYQHVGYQLEQAQVINQNNAKAMREIQLDRQIEREITKKELEAAQKRATSIENVKKEMQNVQGANDPVHPYFDELGDRLRSLNSGTAD